MVAVLLKRYKTVIGALFPWPALDILIILFLIHCGFLFVLKSSARCPDSYYTT